MPRPPPLIIKSHLADESRQNTEGIDGPACELSSRTYLELHGQLVVCPASKVDLSKNFVT